MIKNRWMILGVLAMAIWVVFGADVSVASEISEASEVVSCTDYEMIFARGSGSTWQASNEWLAFARQARLFAERHEASYSITDLQYPAVAVDFSMALGAKVSAGRAFAFNNSVSQGVERLRLHYEAVTKMCPHTQFILVGYSQGAEVVARTARYFAAENLLYVALLGDPGLNLPEGRGIWPEACRGLNFSRYRVFAPTCQTDNGIVSTRTPYEYPGLEGKYGLWCNADDFICGSSKNPLRTQGHMRYGNDETMAWVFLMVDKKLPNVRSLNLSASNLSIEDEYEIVARLAVEEFFVTANENVLLDASSSSSTASDVLQYY